MPWIESHDDIWEHHKTLRLMRELQIDDVTAVGHLQSLWHFVLRNAWRDADLKPWGDSGIEVAARWRGEPGAFVKAMRAVGYLDDTVVHGWLERAGKLVQDRLYNERRKSSATQKNDVLRRKADATLPYPTLPYPTVPDQQQIAQSPEKAGGSVPTNTDPIKAVYPEDFEAFWKAYPRKEGKGTAFRSWKRLGASSALLEAILAALAWQVKQPSWTKVGKDGEIFIPHPSTWLNGRRWEDEKGRPKAVMGSEYQEGKYAGREQSFG